MGETIAIQWGRNGWPLTEWPNGGQWLHDTGEDAIDVVARLMVRDHSYALHGMGASIHDMDTDTPVCHVVMMGPEDETEWPFILETPAGRYGTDTQRMAAAIIGYCED